MPNILTLKALLFLVEINLCTCSWYKFEENLFKKWFNYRRKKKIYPHEIIQFLRLKW